MTAQHTPGPWAMLSEETDKPYIRIRGTKLGDRYKIANVLTPVYDGSLERETEETRANARLIEAAPCLLAELRKARAALKEQLEILIQSHTCPTTGLITDDTALLVIESDQDLINSIDAAIAKATGQ